MKPWPSYGRDSLRTWVRRLASCWPAEAGAFVFFNNDPGGAAVDNAVTFAALAARAGHTVTRARKGATESGR